MISVIGLDGNLKAFLNYCAGLTDFADTGELVNYEE
jgi:hypothetical protein